MQEQERLNPAQRELEAALSSVSPTAVRVDPVAAAFDAGRRAGRRQVGFWRVLTGVALVAGVALRLSPLGGGPASSSHEQVGVTTVVRSADAPRLTDQSLLMLQRAVAEKGLDGLPPAQLWRGGSVSQNDTL